MAKGGIMQSAQFGMEMLISAIALPFEVVGAISKAVDQHERDQSMMHRREVLNQNTRSIMRSRQTMDELRAERLRNMRLERDLKQAEIELKRSQISLNKARESALNAMHNATDPNSELAGAIFNYCNDCKGQQSRQLGDTCVSCGSSNLTPKHLEVRN